MHEQSEFKFPFPHPVLAHLQVLHAQIPLFPLQLQVSVGLPGHTDLTSVSWIEFRSEKEDTRDTKSLYGVLAIRYKV